MKKLVIFLVLVILLGGGGWVIATKMKAANTGATAALTTDIIQRRTLEKIVPANGKVASNRDVDIKCQASGTIKTLPYKDVSKEVKPGEMLCQLDPIDMQRTLATAKALVDADESRMLEAKLNYEISQKSLVTTQARYEAALKSATAQFNDATEKARRTQLLVDHVDASGKPMPLASKEELETAKTTVTQMQSALENAKTAIAELEQQKLQVKIKEQQIVQMQATMDQDKSRYDTARQNVDYCTVFAPIADNSADPPRWFISSLLTNIAPGYIVQSGTSGFSAGTTIMTLSDLSHVFILASVDESNIGQVNDPARGGEVQKVRTTVDAFPGQVFEGVVVRIATKGVSVSNVVTFEVKIEITSDNRSLLRPEMTTTSNIICAVRENVLAVPASDFARTGKTEMAATATAATPATTSAPATRRGRGGAGATTGGPSMVAALNAPKYGIVSVVNDAGVTETRDITVGLMGADPLDPQAGDLYEVLSGLAEGETVVQQKGQDSRFRNQGANQLMRAMGGGGGGRGR